MKKGYAILFFLMLAVLFFWQFWSGGDSTYSEEQRRLWNERKALYPSSWVVDVGVMAELAGRHSSRDIAALIGRDDKTTGKLLEKKKEQEALLVEELEKNRDRSGPDYQVKLPVSVDISRLPLEGLTIREIADRALSGDGDACLKMVQGLCSGKAHGAMDLTWREKYAVEGWLNRAIVLKRPGAVFIKNFLKEVRDVQLSRIRTNGTVVVGPIPGASSLPEYADFENNLKEGDFLLYRTAACLLGAVEFPEAYSLIHKTLLRKAEQGDASAESNLAELYYQGPNRHWKNYLYYLMVEDVGKKKKDWEDWLGWMPVLWRDWVVGGLFSCGFIEADRSTVLEEYRKASRHAQCAARKGNLTGMYWWVMCGITCMDRFSSEEWNDILKYNRILLESGYAPYLDRIRNVQGEYVLSDKVLSDLVLRSFYSSKSYGQVWQKDYLASRGPANESRYKPDKIIHRNNLEETRKSVAALYLTGKTDNLVEQLMTDNGTALFPQCSGEVQAYLVEQLEKWSMEGDIHAMCVLAEIYEKGISVPADPGRAYALLKRALPVSVKYPLMNGRIKNETGIVAVKSIGLQYAIRLRMADIVLKNFDFPGRNEKEAYEETCKVSLAPIIRNDLNCAVEVYRLLGQFHEWGVGVPADREKALKYYKQGAPDSKACRDGVIRLSSSREGEKESAEPSVR